MACGNPISPPSRFNTQPPKGGCRFFDFAFGFFAVSTHSRLKAAEQFGNGFERHRLVSTHSRLKAAAVLHPERKHQHWRFNTQPPKGGCQSRKYTDKNGTVSTHSRLKAAVSMTQSRSLSAVFQHTAA